MPPSSITFGCHLPVFGPIATRSNVLAFARKMEALGYQFWASDHVVLPYSIKSTYPYNATGEFPLPPSAAFLEPLATLALVAGVTERARLGTTILVLPHRHPVLAAKTIATLDHLAEGRVILGVGVGWSVRRSRSSAATTTAAARGPTRPSASCARAGRRIAPATRASSSPSRTSA